MSYLSDEVKDQGLDYADANGNRVDICSQEPTTFAEATETYSLGNSVISVGATSDDDDSPSNGRRVTVSAVSGGTVSANGTATHWALTNDASPGELIAAGALSASLDVSTNGDFDLDAFDLTIRDPS